MKFTSLITAWMIACLLMMSSTGCRKEDMASQPRYDPHQSSSFFADGNSARPLVAGTVSRGGVQSDAYQYDRSEFSTGAPATAPTTGPSFATANFPGDFPHDGDALRRTLERGQQRYNIFCAVCHGETGAGDGMIVQRGFVRPPAFYPIAADARNRPDLFIREQRLLTVPPGYIYDKITNGYGAMYPYASRVAPEDRWAVAAYIQALQMSQSASVSKLSDVDRQAIDAAARGGNP
jgi:mono/diheme cytochrome c family protein